MLDELEDDALLGRRVAIGVVQRVAIAVRHECAALGVVAHHVPDHVARVRRRVLKLVQVLIDVVAARAVPVVLANVERLVRRLCQGLLRVQQRQIARVLLSQRYLARMALQRARRANARRGQR